MNISYIKKIEELSINAWPSFQTEIFDGWLLRFSYQYTYRTNCIEQIGDSNIRLQDKILYCESIYKEKGTSCSFKITPLLSDSFDSLLNSMGYRVQHETEVMTTSLAPHYPEPDLSQDNSELIIQSHLDDTWINALFDLNHTSDPIHLTIVPSMFRAIPKQTIVASIVQNNNIIATGLGILDRNELGIYAINTHQNFRGKHYARAICTALLNHGITCGAKYGYLQVVKNNQPAISLYESLGFHYDYSYWFRSKPWDKL